MIPIVVDADQVRVAVVGEGQRALGRLALLARHGCRPLAVYAPEPCAELVEAAGTALVRRWPAQADFDGLGVVLGGDLSPERAESFASMARAAKTLFNAEDITPLCTFHMPATVRRGNLVLAVSTEGTVPALARQVAQHLGTRFGPEWDERTRALGEARRAWRTEGLDGSAIARKTEALIAEKGWLP